MVPGLPEYIDGVSYWIPDITDLRKQMAEMQGAEMTDRYRRGAERMEAEYVRNLERAKQEIENELNGIDQKLDEEKADAENKDKDKLDSSDKKTVEEKAAKRSADDSKKPAANVLPKKPCRNLPVKAQEAAGRK